MWPPRRKLTGIESLLIARVMFAANDYLFHRIVEIDVNRVIADRVVVIFRQENQRAESARPGADELGSIGLLRGVAGAR